MKTALDNSLPITLLPGLKKDLIPMLCLPVVFAGLLYTRFHTLTPGVIAVLAFLGLGLIAMLIKLIPGANYLCLTEKGFILRIFFRTRPLEAWQKIACFKVITRSGQDFVGFNYKAGASNHPRIMKFNRALAGIDGIIPDKYGKTAIELASLLNSLREKYSGSIS